MPFKERDICRVSAASTNTGKPVGSNSYTVCSEVFFLAISNEHHQVTKPQYIPTELEEKFAYSILFYATTELFASEIISSNMN